VWNCIPIPSTRLSTACTRINKPCPARSPPQWVTLATAPIPLTEGEGQQLVAVVHAIAARITRLVNAPTDADAVGPPT
jgi:hypothetical protein